MSDLVLLHNPRCSKSRAAKALLEDRNVDFQIVEYLSQPLDREALAALGKKLGKPAGEWVRRKEEAFAQAGLSETSEEAAVLDAIASHPILMERPILIRGDRAVIGRPPEDILDLL